MPRIGILDAPFKECGYQVSAWSESASERELLIEPVRGVSPHI